MKSNSLFLNHGSDVVHLCCTEKDELTWIREGHFVNDQLHSAPQAQIHTASEEIYVHDQLLIKRQGVFKKGRLVFGSILRHHLDEASLVATVFYHGCIATSDAAALDEPIIDPGLWSYKDPVSYELQIDKLGVHRAFIYNKEQIRQDYALELILDDHHLKESKLLNLNLIMDS